MRVIIYTVEPGDSVYKIANQYGITTNDVVYANQLSNPDRLAIGQALVIPVDYFEYIVKRGDSLYSIARRYNLTVSQLIDANPSITNPTRIFIGQSIRIPAGNKIIRSIDVNGYAFPNIRDDALDSALPNLTFLSVFSYQVRDDGSVVPINDQRLINAALNNNVKPFMVITNIGESGGFNSDLASTILYDENIKNTLIDNVIQILNEKNYAGLDVDFEYVYPSDREAYNNFLRTVADRIKPLGYILTTAVAPKISANQPGLLYEAHDYPVHGEIADHVIIMTYEWGYTFGPPMAVAPINEVERVLKYAVSVIPSRKILMGMPNYGYDWTLPYRRGSRANAISNLQAVNLAINNGATIQYDEKAQAPFFYYTAENGARHVVWFDDARSLTARLKLVEKYNLGGVSYWTINRLFRTNWYTLRALYDVNR